MPFILTRDIAIQSFQYKILDRILPCNEIDTISHFLLDYNSNKHFWRGWARLWHSTTGFNIKEMNGSILFGFQETVITPLSQTAAFDMPNNVATVLTKVVRGIHNEIPHMTIMTRSAEDNI